VLLDLHLGHAPTHDSDVVITQPTLRATEHPDGDALRIHRRDFARAARLRTALRH
jgi:hypothetical protein